MRVSGCSEGVSQVLTKQSTNDDMLGERGDT